MGNIRKGDRTWKTPNSEKLTSDGEIGGRAVGMTGWQALRWALDRMSTGCYSMCWQIEHQ